MSQESRFFSPQVTSAAHADNSQDWQISIFPIFDHKYSIIFVHYLTLCHRICVLMMICDDLRVLVHGYVVLNFALACLKMNQPGLFKGSGHALHIVRDVA